MTALELEENYTIIKLKSHFLDKEAEAQRLIPVLSQSSSMDCLSQTTELLWHRAGTGLRVSRAFDSRATNVI